MLRKNPAIKTIPPGKNHRSWYSKIFLSHHLGAIPQGK